ncbi:O-antigen ligase family protein [Verrucomicrobiota bacterium]
MLALAFILTLVHLVRERRLPTIPPVAWLGFLHILVLVAVTVFGPYSELGVPKLRKLLWFLGIPLAATVVNTPRRLSGVLGSLTAGTSILCLERCIWIPLCARRAANSGEAASFVDELVRLGSMTDGQTLMLGIVVTLGFIVVCRSAGWTYSWWVALLGLQGAASLLNFKRGSWMVGTGLVIVLLGVKRKFGLLALVVLVLLGSLAVPSVRRRIAGLGDEMGGGERWMMWFRVTPSLREKHPWGIGYRTLTSDAIRKRAPAGTIGPDRDHLHSNWIQTWVDAGWLGLLTYLLWMGWGVADGLRLIRRTRDDSQAEKTNALVLLLMIVGLILNGLVEYNLGDAELVVLYGIIMGCTAAGLRHGRTGAVADLESQGLRGVLK